MEAKQRTKPLFTNSPAALVTLAGEVLLVLATTTVGRPHAGLRPEERAPVA